MDAGPSDKQAKRKRIWRQTASESATCFFSSVYSRRATVEIAITAYLGTFKSTKFGALVVDLLRAITPNGAREDTHTRSVSGKRTTRSIWAPERGRGRLTLSCA